MKAVSLKFLRRSGLILGLIAVATSPGVPDGAQVQVIPFTTVTFNPCTGENIEVTGIWRFVSRVSSDAHEGFHFFIHRKGHGEGRAIGTGTRYILNDSDDSMLQAAVPYPNISTNESEVLLISTGQGENVRAKLSLRFVVNANGEMTVSIIDFSTDCHG